MALQKTLILNNGISLPDAYIKIISLEIPANVEIGGEKKRFALIKTSIQSDANGSLIEMHSSDFQIDMNGKNFIQQAYEHLKSIDKFKGSTDV